ncbi:hypothetical protein ACLOCO_08580 [Lactiplantibacillus plantarum]|uniref:hypothetical protein n=1 Tax=Lactiplantibacillus plantarum TaxID=1590 RepID=UPI003EBDA005
MENYYDLKKAIQNVSDKLATHVGSGDTEHLIVDRQHAGFMSSVQYTSLFNALGFRHQVAVGTDVFELAPGHYEGTNLVNSTKGADDASILMIDVYQFKNYYKQIFEIDAASGAIYFYNEYIDSSGNTNKYSPASWAKIERYVTLWQGNLADITTKAVFNDSAEKFKYLRITTNNQNGSIKSTVVQNAQEINIGDVYVTSDQQSAIIFNARLFVTGQSAQLEYSHEVDVKNSGTSPHVGLGISILKIEGVM